LKPPVLTVLHSIRPRSRSPSPPVLQKFGAITLHHHPPPFLQVPRTHPSKRRKNDYCTPCSSDERRKKISQYPTKPCIPTKSATSFRMTTTQRFNKTWHFVQFEALASCGQ
jgi:hypothetical protein